MSESYTDNLTLDEIKENDVAMAVDAIKNANKYSFGTNSRNAAEFVKHCLDVTLRHVGITVAPPRGHAERLLYASKIDKQLEKAKVKIENRNRYTGRDTWRNGLYVFKDDVLVAFISDVLTVRREEYDRDTFKLSKQAVGFFVVTNARVDNTQRVFSSPGIVH